MLREVKQAVLFTLVTMLLFGGAYPSILWVIGRVAFADRADGSLIRRPDGSVIGSRLIGQPFSQPRYFHPRPSGVDYNAAAAGGTNYAPSNPDQRQRVADRLAAQAALNHVPPDRVPVDMVTASGAGLDPHVSPESAEMQVARVAAARGVAPERIRDLVRAHIEARSFGVLGRPRVNVLELNLALDQSVR